MVRRKKGRPEVIPLLGIWVRDNREWDITTERVITTEPGKGEL